MSSEYADCPELSDISTCANDLMITGIVIWAGLLWIIAKVDECYFRLNMSCKYIGDPESAAGISTYANNPTYVDISAWTSLFWNCISISYLDTKDDVEGKCNRSFSIDDYDDGRCMLNFEVYAGSSLHAPINRLSSFYALSAFVIGVFGHVHHLGYLLAWETDIRKRTKNKAKNDKTEHEMEKSERQSQLKAGDSQSQQKSQPRQIQVNKRRLEG
ncbi:hypothetical protein Tco_1285149 [Tanacetum coccineum]